MRRRQHTALRFAVIFAIFVLAQIFSSGSQTPTVTAPGHARSTGSYHEGIARFSSRDSVGFGVYVSGVDIQADIVDGTTYHRLTIDGAFPYARDGAPAIPVIRKLVAIPDCDQITIEARVKASTTTQEINVRPADRFVPSQTDIGQYDREFTRDDNIYQADTDFPGEYARIEDIGYLRGQRLAWVHVYPVQFNPVRQEITLATDLDIVVRPSNPRGEVNRGVGPMTDILRRLAVNYDLWVGPNAASGHGGGPQASSGNGTVYQCGTAANDWRLAADSVNTLGQPDYLIIMADELSDSLVLELANHRATYNGFNVSIVKMSQIHSTPNITDTPDSIRSFVKAVFEAQSAAHMADSTLAYVLLMGDAYNPDHDVLIPSSYVFADGEIDEFVSASDAYYSFLTTNIAQQDPYPDLFIGRIPADRDSFAPDIVYWELSNIVSKIKNYEPLPVEAWVDSILLVSGNSDLHFSFAGQGASGFDSYFNDVAEKEISPNQYVVKKHRLAAAGSDDTEFSKALNDYVDSTAFRIIGLFDHGFTPGLSGSWFPLHYDTLRNTRSLPLILSFASYTSTFDLDNSLLTLLDPGACAFDPIYTGKPCRPGSPYLDKYDVFSERILLQPNGAIGVIGYSRTQNAVIVEPDFSNVFRSIFQNNAATLGEIVFDARLAANDGTQDVTLRGLQLLGDPAVNILWQDVAWDSVDIAVGANDIRLTTGLKSYSPASNVGVQVTVSNLADTAADSVRVELLDSHPDSSSAIVLDSGWAAPVPAFGSATVTLDAGSFSPGEIELWVHVDPDSEFNEPTTVNNVAARTFTLLPYLAGFPREDATASVGVLLADVNASYPEKEILTGSNCYSSAGEPLWSASPPHAPVLGNALKNGKAYTLSVYSTSQVLRLLDSANGDFETTFALGSPAVGPTPTQNAFPQLNRAILFTDAALTDSLDVLVIGRNSPQDYDLKLKSISGSELWSIPIGSSNLMYYSALSVGDIDLDGSIEALCGFGMLGKPDSIVAIDNGSRQWTIAVGTAPTEIALALADLNYDGDLEILANGGFTEPDSSRLYRLDSSTGSEEYSIGFPDAPLRYAIGDLRSDHEFEVVVAAGDSLCILDGMLQVQDGCSLGDVAGPITQPLLIDIEGDQELEIIALVETTDPVTSVRGLTLQFYDADLDSIGIWYKFAHDSTKVIGHPAIADIDGNGTHDIVFATTDSVLHAIEIGSKAGRCDWAQPFQNAMQTGLIEQPVLGIYSEPVSLFNRVRVVGDAAFDSTLYIDATADIAVVATDTLIELNANGHFTVAGSPLSVVRIHSDPASSDSASWAGIRFENSGGSGVDSMMYFVVRDAATGIETHSPLLIRDGRFENTYSTGVSATDSIAMYRIDISGAEACSTAVRSSDDLLLQASSLRASQYAIDARAGTVVLLTDTLQGAGTGYGVSGVLLDSLVAAATLEDCHVVLFGTGIDAESGVEVTNLSTLACSTAVKSSADLVVEGSSLRASEFAVHATAGTVTLQADTLLGAKSPYGITGIRLDTLVTSTTIENCHIANFGNGIDAESNVEIVDSSIPYGLTGVSTTDSLAIEGCTITYSGAGPAGLAISAGHATIEGSTISALVNAVSIGSGTLLGDTLTAGSTGLQIGGSVTCRSSKITGTSAFTGIDVSSSSDSLTLRETEITGFDTGVYVASGGRADIDSCTISNNDIGVEVYASTGSAIRNSTLDANTTDGIYCHYWSDMTVEGNTITNSSVGIYFLDTSDGAIQEENVIEDHTVGIKCDNECDPVIRENKISGNTIGVLALNDANPDLGVSCGGATCYPDTCSTSGRNSITDNSSSHVVNLSGSLTVTAECNYCGPRGPLPGMFTGTDYSPHLTSDPLPGLAAEDDIEDDEKESLPTTYHMAQNVPNPFNPTTVIRYQVPPPGGRVGIVIYNVRGQKVRTLVSEPKAAGFYDVSWSGRNERGQSVASGVYFVRMTAERFAQTRKLVLLK